MISKFLSGDNLKNRTVFLLLSAISLLIRLPFFFRDYIDRDESTFILMGDSWVRGNLPYTELWDLKPPLVFLFFASLIYIFGKSFIAIRLTGAVVVAIIAYFTFAMGKQLHSRQLGLWAGIACVYLLSLFGSLQGVMSEHLSMLSFMPGLYLLIRYRNPWIILCSGLLVGLALMTKLNLAYAAALVAGFLFYEGYREKGLSRAIILSGLYGTGMLLVIIFSWLPFALEGQGLLWWRSVVLAPLEYSEARRYPVLKMAPILIIVGLFLYLSFRKKWLPWNNRAVQLLVLAVIGVVLSFVKGGRVNGHYLIQFHPIFLVLLGLVLSKSVPALSPKARWLLPLLLLLLPMESYKEYYAIVQNKINRGTYFNGEGFTVPKYLRDQNLEDKSTFFLEYHIGYWLLPSRPPTKAATHPSNLCRDELFQFYENPRKTSMEELSHIMDGLKPEIVVTRYERRIFDEKEEEENEYVQHYLQTHYKVLALVDQALIHRRLEGH